MENKCTSVHVKRTFLNRKPQHVEIDSVWSNHKQAVGDFSSKFFNTKAYLLFPSPSIQKTAPYFPLFAFFRSQKPEKKMLQYSCFLVIVIFNQGESCLWILLTKNPLLSVSIQRYISSRMFCISYGIPNE